MTDETDRPHPDMHYLHMGPWPLFVGFTSSAEAFNAEMTRLAIPDAPEMLARERASATMHSFTSRTACTCIVTLPRARRQSREAVTALLAHETLHIVQEMRRELNQGKPFDDESESYLVQYMTQEMAALYYKTGRKRNTTPG